MLNARRQACRGEPATAMHETFLSLGVGETAVFESVWLRHFGISCKS